MSPLCVSQNPIRVAIPVYTYRHHADSPPTPILKTVAACSSETFGFHLQDQTGCYYKPVAALCHLQAARHTNTVPFASNKTQTLCHLQAAGHTNTVPFARSRTHKHCAICKQHDTQTLCHLQAARHTNTVPFASSTTHKHCAVCKQQDTQTLCRLHSHCINRPLNRLYLNKEIRPTDCAITALHTSSPLPNAIFSSSTPGLCQPVQSTSR